MKKADPNDAVRKQWREIREILARVDGLPVIDLRTPEEIVGYDERGLPEKQN